MAVVFSLSFQGARAQNPPASPSFGPVAGRPWTNSLGVKFVPAGTDGVLFSVWDVRVKDFKAFVDATGYDATKGMVSFDNDGTDGWKARGDTWKSPGFAQTDDDPVVGVNLDDAKAFCAWLTKKEQAEGKLGANQLYRLPSDAEWSKAVGLNESSEGTPQSKGLSKGFETVYPWGSGWPPRKVREIMQEAKPRMQNGLAELRQLKDTTMGILERVRWEASPRTPTACTTWAATCGNGAMTSIPTGAPLSAALCSVGVRG